MPDMAKVDPELAQRVMGMIHASGKRFWVSSAYRDDAEQAILSNRWQEGLRRHGSRAKAMAAGYVPANPPGKSKHGIKPARAVDVACFRDDDDLRAELAEQFGLHTPIRGEDWHMELRPKRLPMPLTVPPARETEDMLSRYITVPCPTGGYWLLKRSDGGVGVPTPETNKAPFFGALPGVAKVVAPLVGLTPCVLGGVVIGYWIYDVAGHIYAFGKAPHYAGYAEHKQWQSPKRRIVGLVQTSGATMPPIRYTQIGEEDADGDFVVDEYDLGPQG